MKDTQKNFRLSSKDLKDGEEVRKTHRVTDDTIYRAGIEAFNAARGGYGAAADAAERDLIATNEKRRKADLDAYFQRLRNYVGDADKWIKLRCKACGHRFENAEGGVVPTQTKCPNCERIVDVPAQPMK